METWYRSSLRRWRTDILDVGESTLDVGESTLDVGELTVGETTRRRNDRKYNEDPAITNIFFGTVTLRYGGVPRYIQK